MIINWENNVNKRVLRDGSSWVLISKVQEDISKSGKPKRRYANSFGKQPFSVKMRFTYDEFILFRNWYENKCKCGLNPFYFPRLDDVDGTKEYVVYQFVAGSEISVSNPSGKLIDVSMNWERV